MGSACLGCTGSAPTCDVVGVAAHPCGKGLCAGLCVLCGGLGDRLPHSVFLRAVRDSFGGGSVGLQTCAWPGPTFDSTAREARGLRGRVSLRGLGMTCLGSVGGDGLFYAWCASLASECFCGAPLRQVGTCEGSCWLCGGPRARGWAFRAAVCFGVVIRVSGICHAVSAFQRAASVMSSPVVVVLPSHRRLRCGGFSVGVERGCPGCPREGALSPYGPVFRNAP